MNLSDLIMVFNGEVEVKYTDFKAAYKKAEENGEESFTIQGVDFHTGYAKYMLEYLEQEFETNVLVNPQISMN